MERLATATVSTFKLDFPAEEFTQKAVQRRRAAEEARKARIHNTRLRVIGLDVDALNDQVVQRKRQESAEKQRDKAFDAIRLHQDHTLLRRDAEDKDKRAARHVDLTRFWAAHQRAEDSRDADLQLGLKRALSPTMPESDLGPASMQVFAGEAIGEAEMKREQRKQTDRDLLAQMVDNERKHMGDKHRELLVGTEMKNQDRRWLQQAALEEECKRAERMALDNYNQALASEQAAKQRDDRQREERENLNQTLHVLTSDMMTECADAALREVEGGPPLVLVDRWKGMTPEELRNIYREREEQRVERERHRHAEKLRDAVWDFQLLKLSRQAAEEESRIEELRRDRRVQTERYNVQLAREQQAYQDYLNNKLYTNKPTKDYFLQFSSGSR